VWDFGLEETEDFLIFQFALDHNHVIVTGNIFEFRQFQKELAAKGKITPGAIYVPGRYHKNTTLIVQRILEVEIDEYYAGGEWWVGS
jgi:hypothetical protein